MAQPTRILIALFFGLALGIAGARFGWEAGLALAEPVGAMWLDALRMTIVPLVVALLVRGIAQTADSARGGRVALHSVILFIGLLWISTAIAAVLVPGLLDLWPIPKDAAEALRSGVTTQLAPVAPPPPIGEFLRSIVPTNPVAAAAEAALLPLIVFTAIFALAMTRLPEAPRVQLLSFFSAIADTMLVVIGWVLWIAPIGIFALAFSLGIHAGTSAIGALLHYILIVSAAGVVAWAMAYPMAMFGAGWRLGEFTRAIGPVQAVALSTQSSLASLPPMLKACERLGVPVSVSSVSLPIAVAIFRITSPAMNLAVAIYVAHWFGIPLTPATIAAGAVVAGITTVGTVSLPGQLSFLTSITPIAVAMGVPLEPLALLVAVEMIPDLIRTLGNVTMDVAATGAIARHNAKAEPDHV